MELVKCPRCGESYYQEDYSTCTCIGWAPIYKNGVLINENPNVSTTHCTCLNCGNHFTYSNKDTTTHQTLSASLDCIVPGTSSNIATMSVL